MHSHKSKLFKAALLLMLFAFHFTIGMGCAFGLCICVHKNCKEKQLTASSQAPCHHHKSLPKEDKPEGCNGGCCNDTIIKFSHIDKSFPEFISSFNFNSFIALISSFYSIDRLNIFKGHANTRYYVLGHHPPIPDIRVAICSFQI